MILTCPSCSTRYVVDPNAIGRSGRTVRCANCHHTWQEAGTAPGDSSVISNYSEPVEASSAAAEFDSPSFGADTRAEGDLDGGGFDDRPVDADDYRTLAPGSNLPALMEDAPRKRSVMGWLIFLVVFLGTIALIVVERNVVVHYWPPATRLYAVLHLPLKTLGEGLELKDVSVTRRDDSGALTLEGTVANTSKLTHEVPRLVAIINTGASPTPWQHAFMAGPLALQPGETAHFTTELADPPKGGTSLAVTFTDQR